MSSRNAHVRSIRRTFTTKQTNTREIPPGSLTGANPDPAGVRRSIPSARHPLVADPVAVTTVADVTAQPSSGLNHIDALLDQGPGWNFLAPARAVLRYTFSLTESRDRDLGRIFTGELATFNATQEAATVQALARVAQITGIHFERVADASAADLHFALADVVGPGTAGYTSTYWNYRFDGRQVITAYGADAFVYLDNVEFAGLAANPTPGSAGFEVLLHELGHALGLKHPFEGAVRLPATQDNTRLTLMSYTDAGGPYRDFAPYDVAALLFLYGGDGLGGAYGVGSAGRVLVGTDGADSLVGTDGPDRLEGRAGSDTLRGGGGVDIAGFARARADYRLTRPDANGSFTVRALAGDEGTDTLREVERVKFADLSLAFDLQGAAGTAARCLGLVFGREVLANAPVNGIALGLLDGGTGADALMRLALDLRLGAGHGDDALVDLLYQSLIGLPPTEADRAQWTGLIASGAFTQVSLALAAAALELNAQNIGLAGLAADGLPYT